MGKELDKRQGIVDGDTCEEVKVFASDYIDNELPRNFKLRLKNHILECKKCRVFIRELKEVVRFSKGLYTPVPEGVRCRLRVLLKKEMQANPVIRRKRA